MWDYIFMFFRDTLIQVNTNFKLPQGLTLTRGLLRCILLMSITLTDSTAIQVAMPTLTTTTALTLFRCVVCSSYIHFLR